MDIEKLYREYFTPVYRYTLSLVHDPDMAEEITQETFFRALKKINDYRGEASLKVWLCQIARNLSFDSLKKQYKDIAKSDEDVLSIALFGDVAIKFIEQRNEDAIPTLIHVEA